MRFKPLWTTLIACVSVSLWVRKLFFQPYLLQILSGFYWVWCGYPFWAVNRAIRISALQDIGYGFSKPKREIPGIFIYPIVVNRIQCRGINGSLQFRLVMTHERVHTSANFAISKLLTFYSKHFSIICFLFEICNQFNLNWNCFDTDYFVIIRNLIIIL